MLNSRALLLGIGLLAFTLSGCGGSSRVLTVQTDPPDAEVCVKGRAKSEFFSNQKSCVGTTPFEADFVKARSASGGSHEVHFHDVESAQEKFWILVSRPGYLAQTAEVPTQGWDLKFKLEPDTAAAKPAKAVVPAPVVPVATPEPAAPVELGQVKISSEPVGAVVTVDGMVRGNAPYTYEGPAGKILVRLEYEGYETLERTIEVRGSKLSTIQLPMMRKRK